MAHQLTHRPGWQRRSPQPALCHGAAEFLQQLKLVEFLNALCHEIESQAAPEGHDAGEDRAIRRVGRGIGDEALVDLEHMHRQPAKVVEACVAGSEVIHRDADPLLGEGANLLRRRAARAQYLGLGDLQLQRLRRQREPLQIRPDRPANSPVPSCRMETFTATCGAASPSWARQRAAWAQARASTQSPGPP